jgi:hypothetical protein
MTRSVGWLVLRAPSTGMSGTSGSIKAVAGRMLDLARDCGGASRALRLVIERMVRWVLAEARQPCTWTAAAGCMQR